jgi:alcohol dehydrogenase YqhD (iron-dependent ADH family)
MRFAAKSNTAKYVQFAERIFGLKAKGADDLDCALEAIDRFEEFLRSIDCPTRFSELGIDDSLFETYAKDTLKIVSDGKGNLPGRPFLSVDDMVEIFRSAL